MTWLRTVLREILGLFVDDRGFAACILAWLLLVWLLPPVAWSGILLFAGLAVILAESALRRARQ